MVEGEKLKEWTGAVGRKRQPGIGGDGDGEGRSRHLSQAWLMVWIVQKDRRAEGCVRRGE
jgi:hypothetical protein